MDLRGLRDAGQRTDLARHSHRLHAGRDRERSAGRGSRRERLGRGLSSSITETSITQATSPLADADWKHTIDGRYITWEAPGAQVGGVQFDAFAAQRADSPLPTWTIWGGHAVHQPTWALHLSAKTPADLVQYIAFEMAEGQGTRLVLPASPDAPALRTAPVPAPVTAPPPAAHLPGRSR